MENLETLTQDQLRELAFKNILAPEAEPEPEAKAEPVRDPKTGKFAKAEDVEEVEEVVYERVIDIGDGSGAQVFRGKSLEELVDNLAKAQENGTRKIREQQAELRAKRVEAAKVVEENDELSDDEKYILSQKILTDPMAVIQSAVKKELSQRERAQEAQRRTQEERDKHEFDEAKRWADANPEYQSTERNAKRLLKWLQMESLTVTGENLQKAFEDLNESGLLEVKPEEQHQNAEHSEEVEPARIERKTEATVVRRKVVGGLSGKRSAPAPPAKTSEPNAEDFAKMTQEQLRDLAYKAVMG